MNKTDFIEAIAHGTGATKVETTKFLDMFMKQITETLQKGDQIVLPGFGSFLTGTRAARKGRNPQTGKEIQIKASRVAKFKAGKALKEAVQES